MSGIATLPPSVSEFAATLESRGAISDEDVLKLRREIFADGLVDRAESDLIFHLEKSCRDKCEAWSEFFVGALTDFFVWKQDPRGYLSDAAARYLIESIAPNGTVSSRTELEFLINVVHWSSHCPEEVVLLCLEAVKESVLQGTGAYGEGRVAGVIDQVDVELVRKVIYAQGGDGSLTITRREAELLFDLKDATVNAQNADTWQDLFVRAVASHLMFPRGAPSVADADEMRRRDAWLSDRRGVGGLLMAVGRALANPVKSWSAAGLGDEDGDGTRRSAVEREAFSRESIDAAEAEWLIARITKDGILHPNERALMVFIKENSPRIHPSLMPLFEEFGL